MAILIPSKNIYKLDTKDIVNNKITAIDATVNEVTPSLSTQTVKSESTTRYSSMGGRSSEIIISQEGGKLYLARAGFSSRYILHLENIKIPIYQGNNRVKSLVDNTAHGDDFPVKVRLTLEKKEYLNVYQDWKWINNSFQYDDSKMFFPDSTPDAVKYSSVSYFPEKITATNGNANAEVRTTSGANTDKLSYTIQGDYIIIASLFMDCGFSKAYSLIATTTSDPEELNLIGIARASGTGVSYTPTLIEISIDGLVYTLDVRETSRSYGLGENPHSLDGNELIQDDTTIYKEKCTKYIADKILSQYENGKRTATVLCDVGDYVLDGDKTTAISKRGGKMLFELFDEVSPNVYTNNGDEPLTQDAEGNTKTYDVSRVKIEYDGACWQELSLLEK